MSRRIGWAVWGFCFALATLALVLSILGVGEREVLGDRETVSVADAVGTGVYFFAILSAATVGAVLIWRRTGNGIGWVFLAIGAVVAVRVGAQEYAYYSLLIEPGSLPAGRLAIAIGEGCGPLPYALPGLAVLLFPDGRLPSPRWRKVPWILGGAAFAGVVGNMLRPGRFVEAESFERFTNPLGVGSDAEPFEALAALGWLVVPLALLACGVAMVRRKRRAQGIERLQLKWMGFAASVFAVGFLLISITFFAGLSGEGIDALRVALLGIGISTIPIAAGIAMLRYRLYDIDVVINRTLVYGVLTAMLALTYLGSVLLLQLVLSGVTEGSSLAVAASTLAVAALVRPARSRVQGAVDRRFYRRKYDAQRTLESFSARLREQVDLDSLTAELRGVVAETMQPAHVSLWLRAPRARR